MKITKKWLKNNNACQEGQDWFFNQKEVEGIKVVRTLIKNDNLVWANWLIVRMMNKKQKVGYAIYAAEQVISIFESKYPNDDRPRKAIKAAKRYLNNQSRENATYAVSAASAASASAIYAASSASAAANYAASAASASAISTASSAYTAAATSAAYASSAANYAYAADKNMKVKILNYSIKLFG